VWTGAENLASTEIRSAARPAHSGSLYRLPYPGPEENSGHLKRVYNFQLYFLK
jgi:hypothetical protein